MDLDVKMVLESVSRSLHTFYGNLHVYVLKVFFHTITALLSQILQSSKGMHEVRPPSLWNIKSLEKYDCRSQVLED